MHLVTLLATTKGLEIRVYLFTTLHSVWVELVTVHLFVDKNILGFD